MLNKEQRSGLANIFDNLATAGIITLAAKLSGVNFELTVFQSTLTLVAVLSCLLSSLVLRR